MKIDTFTCDTCKRAIDVDNNPTGVTAFPRCIITANCRGLMSQTRKMFVTSDQYQTSGTSPDAWYQRPMMFNHTQSALRKVWTVKHNLGTIPILNVHSNDISDAAMALDETEYTIKTLNEHMAAIAFDTARTGTVQCLVRQSANGTITEPNITPSNNQTIPVVLNQTIVIASKAPITSIGLVINSNPRRTVTLYPHPTMLVSTPWIGVKQTIINDETLNVIALDASTLNTNNGAAASYWFDTINGSVPAHGEVYVLLAKDPYNHPADRLLSNVIDLATLGSTAQSLTSLIGNVMYCDPRLVVSIYPPMEQIE